MIPYKAASESKRFWDGRCLDRSAVFRRMPLTLLPLQKRGRLGKLTLG